MPNKSLNIFYEEPDPDRWVKYDRYPRRIIRRIFRGKPKKSGQFLVFYNLVQGLKKLNIPYRINDYRYIVKHPEEVACIIGRDGVLDKIAWKNPIAFGSAFGINPVSHPDILAKYPIKKLLVPGDWVKDFFEPYGADNVEVWPVGLDTEEWKPVAAEKKTDFLLYNKIRWDHAKMDEQLVEPIRAYLKSKSLTFTEIKYGHYKPEDLKVKLAECKYAIFICEHETQGIAYQQMLSSNMPILAWDRGGYWQDPNWYPDIIKFEPVSAVPYWDAGCGVKFTAFDEFGVKLDEFLALDSAKKFNPREYILKNLTLEICAAKYADIIASITTTDG